ncbi:hypothetical protein PPACK8108_LOCUS19614 [Phakopsora pachyrhizi]|uniref:Uncharacterized protein n=1 Tax=Phakopsora pachyrhizi TaxID=170000 RepID=A0AAV0BFF8_PHAPC|nr:hypothetical protein PPACK8108_LOCUS19614 [Phakopsora pachyrhizi]
MIDTQFICYRCSSLVFTQSIHFISIIVFLLILLLILIIIVSTVTIAIIILFHFIMFSYTASVDIQKCGRRAYVAKKRNSRVRKWFPGKMCVIF